MAGRFYDPHTNEWQQRPEAPKPSFICGLDLGQVSDPTALCVLQKQMIQRDGKEVRHYGVRHLQRWLGTDYPSIAEALRPMLAQLYEPMLVVDATGVGNAVVDILRKAQLPIRWLVPIVITAGHQVTKASKGGWNVPKRELVSVTQSALQGKRLDIAPSLKDAHTLRRELQNFKYKINLNASESFEAWREGDHDDLCLAACMAVWHGEYNDRKLAIFV